MSKRLTKLLAVVVMSGGLQMTLAATPAPVPTGSITTIKGERVPVAAARTQPCGADSCANRVEVSAMCPVGANVLAVHYFTNASYPADLADVYETGPVEVSWAYFTPAVIKANQNGQQVATTYYYNRSNRNRVVAISLDCQ